MMTSPNMVFKKTTLSFRGKEDEKEFAFKYFNDSILQLRITLLVSIIIYAIFGKLDLLVFPEQAKILHSIRFLFVIPIMSLILLLSFTKIFVKLWQWLVAIFFIVGGLGIGAMILLQPDSFAYYGGLLLIFMGGYTFIKLRFIFATAAGWIITIIFNIAAIYIQVPTSALVVFNFFFVGANVIGMFAVYNIEYFTRRDFFLNQKLLVEKIHVEEFNQNLEQTIEERTKELVKAKNKAEESDRLKSAFLANISHEIRTPMNAIVGFSSLLEEPGIEGETQKEYIDIIGKSSIRMLNIINDILDISKIEAGVMKVRISTADINTQLNDTYSTFKIEAEKKGLTLTLSKTLPTNEANIKTDHEKISAILVNLVKNAIKYSEKGSIDFGCEKKNQTLEFFVRDTGMGIPQNKQNIIFDRFVQADIENKKALQGAGLGLSICKSYVEMLGGKIWVESVEGAGSTFYFTLPNTVFEQ